MKLNEHYTENDWFCENHPESLMGHDGCSGCGINYEARIDMLCIQRRNALQELKECRIYYENIVESLIKRIYQLEDSIDNILKKQKIN